MTTALSTGARRRALIAATTTLIGLSRHVVGACAGGRPNSRLSQRQVRLVVGFPAGSGPDIVARLLAQKLSEGWGNLGVIVDNKPGAGGLIAASEVARAQPDGYTLMLGETGQLAIAPSSYSKLSYDPKKDFVPVSQVVTSNFMLVVNPAKVPARDVKQFVEWSRGQKGLFMGTFGAGTPGHFGAFLFGDAIGIKPEPVHYKTTGDALGGLFSGDVWALASVGLSAANTSWKAGKLLALASSGDTRSARPARRSDLPRARLSAAGFQLMVRRRRRPGRRQRSSRGSRPTSAKPCSRPKARRNWRWASASRAPRRRSSPA